MVGGNKEAQSPAENPHVSWSCGQTKSVMTPRSDTPYDCTPWAGYGFVDGIVAAIDFPSCWNGTGLRPEDVTYPVAGACPPGFGHVIPKLSERVHYGVMNPMALDGTPRVRALERPLVHAARRLLEHLAAGPPRPARRGLSGREVALRLGRRHELDRVDAAVRHAALRPRVRGRARRPRRVVRRRLHELRARGSDVPPPLRRVPEPVRRRRRRGVDQAVRHERDRSGARDRRIGEPTSTSAVRRTGASPNRSTREGATDSWRCSKPTGRGPGSTSSGRSGTTRCSRSRRRRGASTSRGPRTDGSRNRNRTGHPMRSSCASTPTDREDWARQLGGPGEDSARALSVWGSRVYLAGVDRGPEERVGGPGWLRRRIRSGRGAEVGDPDRP